MTIAQIERILVDLIHQEPFVPFHVELISGERVFVPHPRLAINQSGAGFVGPEGGIVDIDFANVRAIEVLLSKKSA